jgi:uncharacterized membrane protein YbhN (UPF0104 family)
VLSSLSIAALDIFAVASMVRAFGVQLSALESLMLLSASSLSTLVPTAPAFLGTYQLVSAKAFQLFGYPETIGINAASAVQIFCFGSVTMLGGLILLSRSALTIWRGQVQDGKVDSMR